MNARQRTSEEATPDPGGEHPQSAWLRALYAAADLPLKPPEALEQRVAEMVARHNAGAPQRSARAWIPGGWPRVPRTFALTTGAGAVALLLAILASTFVGWDHSQSSGPSTPRFARQSHPGRILAPLRSPRRPAGDARVGPVAVAPQATLPVRPAVPERGGHRERPIVTRAPSPRPGTWVSDDLAYANGVSTDAVSLWAAPPRDEWERLEARIRRAAPVRDDFVHIPFPRLAAASNRQVAAAVESYKREAAIADSRLSCQVTLQLKATALSDVCERLRNDTAIRLETGRSVADEKVTVFCKNLPLREVMRELSRPFGYTWLRSGKDGEYRYELVQDLRSQLLEEELGNRNRNAALLALEQEMGRYRPYLDLSPDEAMARAGTAAPAEKKLLETLANYGWGPIQMFYRLSRDELAALRTGQRLTFSQEPGAGEYSLPPEVARGALQSLRDEHFVRRDDRLVITGGNDPNGLPLTAAPEARALVTLVLDQSELGRFTFGGGTGYRIVGTRLWSHTGRGPYATGLSPTVLKPDNRVANAGLAGDSTLRLRVSIRPQASCGGDVETRGQRSQVGDTGRGRPQLAVSPRPLLRTVVPAGESKITSADVLEAVHRTTGVPIIADYYTQLYTLQDVCVEDLPLFEALNHLADAMRMRWTKEGGWLQFRSASFYEDRLKEVPNRLLKRWEASRRRHGGLTLDDLAEIGQLSDAQLDAAGMAEGARQCFGLLEWDTARQRMLRPHLRCLAQLTPAQRQTAMSTAGLAFNKMTLQQQQQFIALALEPYIRTTQSLADLAEATVRVGYTRLDEFGLKSPNGSAWEKPFELALVRERTPEAALRAARRIDAQVQETEIVPVELSVTVVYTWGSLGTPGGLFVTRATPNRLRDWLGPLRPTPDGGRSQSPPR